MSEVAKVGAGFPVTAAWSMAPTMVVRAAIACRVCSEGR